MKGEIFASETDLQKLVIDKMNGIAKQSTNFTNEKYELRCQRDKDPKYIQLRCVQKKCKFSIWFNFQGNATSPTKLSHARNINMSHVISEHQAEQQSSNTSSSKESEETSENKSGEKMETE